MPGAIWRHACTITAYFLAAVILSSERQKLVNSFRFANTRHDPKQRNHRRIFIASVAQITSTLILEPIVHRTDAAALSIPFIDQQQDRRQKELCLVNLLRLQYWAVSVSDKLKELDADDEEGRKRLYLEARLGSKVMVAGTKKISGGATANVFMLKGLHLRECLDDLTYYADKSSKRQMNQYREDLIESIASIVEFDGLETTQDDSPRSSLTLSMYNSQKSIFVERMLGERIVPLTNDIIRVFGPDTRVQIEAYMKEFYPSEMKSSTPS
mmetsp:Transcript_6156/g.15221  ORF Transcript_6156/g.15221 Transcript_6156/m.15221 type:complete len:269 (-) Transcript_6156:2656-3462(-)